MKKNKAFTKWKNLLNDKAKGQPFTESDIIYFRKAVGPSGIKDDSLRYDLRDAFSDNMPSGGYDIEAAQKLKGIEYLRSNTFKLNGSLRKNNIFGEFELGVIKDFADFKLIGLSSNLTAGGFDMGYTLPVYRCIAADGRYFDYTGTVYSMIEVLKAGRVQGVA